MDRSKYKYSITSSKKRTIIEVGDIRIGEDFLLIAGPCSVESEIQTITTAKIKITQNT